MSQTLAVPVSDNLSGQCIAPPTGADFPVQPVGGFLIVRWIKPFEERNGKLVIPDRVKANEQMKALLEMKTPLKGVVVAVGPGQIVENRFQADSRRGFDCKVGDTIYFRPLGTYELKVLGHDYMLLGDEDVLAVVKGAV